MTSFAPLPRRNCPVVPTRGLLLLALCDEPCGGVVALTVDDLPNLVVGIACVGLRILYLVTRSPTAAAKGGSDEGRSPELGMC